MAKRKTKPQANAPDEPGEDLVKLFVVMDYAQNRPPLLVGEFSDEEAAEAEIKDILKRGTISFLRTDGVNQIVPSTRVVRFLVGE